MGNFLQAMKSKSKKKSSTASKVALSHGVQESAGEKKTERSLNGLSPLEAYNICSVEACFEEVSGPGECCTGSWCDADSGICYTDAGCTYVYSDAYTHTGRRLEAARKLYDRCYDNAFVACVATYTGTTTDYNGNAFVTTCEDDEHDDDDDD